jgi:hypothetical protein
LPSRISAPVAATLSGIIAFTVAAVPTGMKAGVRISPLGVEIFPVRALPSLAATEYENRSVILLRYHLLQPFGPNTRIQLLDT